MIMSREVIDSVKNQLSLFFFFVCREMGQCFVFGAARSVRCVVNLCLKQITDLGEGLVVECIGADMRTICTSVFA